MLRKISTAVILGAVLWSAPASAGVFTDDLTKCLVKSTSDADKTDLIIWIFAALASHPAVKPYSNISTEQRDQSDDKAANLLLRLLAVDCKAETTAALQYERAEALTASFRALGEAAASGLMTHPDVQKALGGLETHIDAAKWKSITGAAN